MKDMTKTRNSDFVRRCVDLYESEAARGNYPPLDEILFKAIAQRPMAYYVNFDRASRQLHRIERDGLDAVAVNRLSRRMWTEMREQIDEVMRDNPGKRFDSALSYVLNFRRPSRFFINLDTARRIIRPYLNYTLRRRGF